ncbi:GAF and ANTAR domain-containing protein [Jatrophihabitans fulvus]
MTDDEREAHVLDAVVTLVDSLLQDFDLVELLTDLTERCVGLLDVASAGLLLADPRRRLRLMASTSDTNEGVELFQLQADEGPCLDCFAAGQPVSVADLADTAGRWPRFTPVARAAGYASVHAVPMRAAGGALGALGLFGTRPGVLNEADLLVGRSLAHVASVAIVQEHPPTSDLLLPRLRGALARRTVVEQAQGYVRETLDVGVAEALSLLRRYARTSGIHLSDVARLLVSERDARPAILTGLRELVATTDRDG